MPIYSILNTETDDIFEVNLKFNDLESYLYDNPSFKQVFTKFPASGDPARLGKKKPDDGFRDVLREVGNVHKKNDINTW